MASVQELLAAAQAQKSPLQALLEGAAQGFSKGYAEAPKREADLMDLQDRHEARVRAIETDKLLRAKIAGAQEDKTKASLNAVGGESKAATPGLKLEKVTVDPKSGLLKPEFQVLDKKPSPYQPKDYLDKAGKARIGRFDPDTGKILQSPDDAFSTASVTLGEKQDQFLNKRLTAFGDALDPSKARTGAFGVSKGIFDRAEKLQTMATAYKDGNYDSRQIEELAIGLNAMLSGSNVGAASQVAALVPKSIVGNAAKLQEWLTNEPQGANQQAFVQRMMGTVEREKATAAEQIRRTQLQRIQRYADLEKHAPDEFYNVMQSAGVDPEDYKSWKKGGYKAISAVQAPEGGAAAADIHLPGDDGKRLAELRAKKAAGTLKGAK